MGADKPNIRAWITESGAFDRIRNRPIAGHISLEGIHIALSVYPELNQSHLTLSYDALICLRDAINDFERKFNNKVSQSCDEETSEK